MIVAVVSDVHANLEALDAVLADQREMGAQRIWCLGDIVGYGADPDGVVDRLTAAGAVCVAGNHDRAACGQIRLGYFNAAAAAAAIWTSETIRPDTRSWLEALPLSVVEDGVRLVHASPSDPPAWRYVLSVSEAEGEFRAFEEALCLIGHSHFPGAFELDGDGVRYSRSDLLDLDPECRYLVNVGSVGQPRDGDPRACYLLYDLEERRLMHRRVPYDVAAAQQKIRAAGLPLFLADRLSQGV